MITDLCPPYVAAWCTPPADYIVMVAHSRSASLDHRGTLVAWLALAKVASDVYALPQFQPFACDGPNAPTMLIRGRVPQRP